MDQILKNLKLAELEQLSQQIKKELDVRYRQKTAETIKDHIEQHGYYAKAGYDTYELNDPKIHYVDFKIKIQLTTFDHLNFTNPIPELYDSDGRYQSKIYKYLHLPKVPAEWTFGSDIWECHGQHMPSTQLVDSNIRIWHKPILPDEWFLSLWDDGEETFCVVGDEIHSRNGYYVDMDEWDDKQFIIPFRAIKPPENSYFVSIDSIGQTKIHRNLLDWDESMNVVCYESIVVNVD